MDSLATSISDIIDTTIGDLGPIFDQMEWAEDEIRAAKACYPGCRDLIHHSFSLVRPTHDLMATEFLYRAHCREMLGRVSSGEDTRPGTAAEIICMCYDASQVAPMNGAGVGLYGRLWLRCFPDRPTFDAAEQKHYEALHGSRIDALEREARARLRNAERTHGEIRCMGMHHGERVACSFASGALDAA